MSHYPPYPSARPYSPSRSYGEPVLPPFPPNGPPSGRDYPPYPYSNSAPPPSSYRAYDPYTSEPPRSANYSYEQPRRSYDSESYDPYQPGANAYEPLPPSRGPPSYASGPPPRSEISRPPPPTAAPSVRRSPPPSRIERAGDARDLTLLTPPTTVTLNGYTTAVHSLPPSHLPITKYVSINRDDAIDLHRQLCSKAVTVWYADGSSRAGEGWSAAIEWIIDSTRSGSKMRGYVGNGDALDAELGGICKAVEGFQELLNQSIKDTKPMSHELLVFCDSQAAIASIDTSSRPEALRFEQIWREICSEFLHAHMTIAWLPKGCGIEGLVLANKIAMVGASNSYLKRKKDGSLSEIHRRQGGGDPAPPGSSEAGPWQRGDAEPSRRKELFERPRPRVLSPILLPALSQPEDGLRLDLHKPADAEPEEEGLQPREGSIFVTHFPDQASAKDLGILFAQYGNIVAVDIYHISPTLPRFAFVAYTDPASGLAAIDDLHHKSIKLDTPFARDQYDDLEVWRTWDGQLTIVLAEPPRLVPSSVAADFPNLPDWALGIKEGRGDEADKMEVDSQVKQERELSPDSSKKRDRRNSQAANKSSPHSSVDSPSPRKRMRQDLATAFANQPVSQTLQAITDHQANNTADGQPDHLHTQPTLTHAHLPPPTLPPFAPTLKNDGPAKVTPPLVLGMLAPSNGEDHQAQGRSLSGLPPTPDTAERPLTNVLRPLSPPRQLSLEPTSISKRPLTNSASEPQEYPIKVGAKTLRAQIELVKKLFGKVDNNNWIAHTCFIASDLNEFRRALKEDLYATDQAFLTGRDLEAMLASRGFTAQRVDIFITKVLKVLDGIAAAEEGETESQAENAKGGVEALEKELVDVLDKYPDQTKEAVTSAAKLLEYLVRGKEAQERKRLEVERRVKVLEGMVKIGEVVGGVVRFLLTEDKA